MSVPIAYQGSVIGLLQVADRPADYGVEDVHFLEAIASHVGPVLHARMERDRVERKEQWSQKTLRQLEWLFSPDAEPNAEDSTDYVPPCGDVAKPNTCREVVDSVGVEVLKAMVSDHLVFLNTSSVVYEKNGDYALGMFASGWCRLLDHASRQRCRTEDNREPLSCGKWLCHESCWTDASKVAMESGTSVDIECHGGTIELIGGQQPGATFPIKLPRNKPV